MTEGGSILTLSFYAAEKVVPHYNVMAVAKAGLESTVRYLASSLGDRNIRVNAISAGPIKTLAARGVGDLGEMLKAHSDRAPPPPQRRPARSRRRSPVFGQRPLLRHHRRSHVRRLRLQHHGVLKAGNREQLRTHPARFPILTAEAGTRHKGESITRAGAPPSAQFHRA